MFKLVIKAATAPELCAALQQYAALFVGTTPPTAAPVAASVQLQVTPSGGAAEPAGPTATAAASTTKPAKSVKPAKPTPPADSASTSSTKTTTSPSEPELKPEQKRDLIRSLLSPLMEGAKATQVRELVAPFGSVSKIPDESLDKMLADTRALAAS